MGRLEIGWALGLVKLSEQVSQKTSVTRRHTGLVEFKVVAVKY